MLLPVWLSHSTELTSSSEQRPQRPRSRSPPRTGRDGRRWHEGHGQLHGVDAGLVPPELVCPNRRGTRPIRRRDLSTILELEPSPVGGDPPVDEATQPRQWRNCDDPTRNSPATTKFPEHAGNGAVARESLSVGHPPNGCRHLSRRQIQQVEVQVGRRRHRHLPPGQHPVGAAPAEPTLTVVDQHA